MQTYYEAAAAVLAIFIIYLVVFCQDFFSLINSDFIFFSRSNLNFISACNCGKRQNSKEDPFNLCDANFTFYSEMEEECCHGLERTLVPFHDSGTKAKFFLETNF